MPVRRSTHPRRSARIVVVSLSVALIAALTLVGGGQADAAATAVGLGTASSFAVLAGSTVTNTGPSLISGDLGVSPGTAVTGFPPGLVINGTVHSADALAGTAQADATTAYNAVAAEPSSATITADLGGQTLDPGVYTGTTLGLTGTLTLDAHDDPDAVFVFQSAETLITASSSAVSLINGATACNVYWQIGSSATLGTNSSFVGTILSQISVTATTGAIVAGRLLASSGAVTLDSNTITSPTCPVIPTTTTTTTAPVTTAPATTAPVTTAPVTTAPATTAPATTAPATTAPVTTAPATTAPATTVPATTAPATTAPVTTAPATTAPATTAPATTAPATTAPATTAPDTTAPATTAPATNTSAPSTTGPSQTVPDRTLDTTTTSTTTDLVITPPTIPGDVTSTTAALEVTPPTQAEATATTADLTSTGRTTTGTTTPSTTTDLARTGFDIGGLLAAGLAALLAGVLLTIAARRAHGA